MQWSVCSRFTPRSIDERGVKWIRPFMISHDFARNALKRKSFSLVSLPPNRLRWLTHKIKAAWTWRVVRSWSQTGAHQIINLKRLLVASNIVKTVTLKCVTNRFFVVVVFCVGSDLDVTFAGPRILNVFSAHVVSYDSYVWPVLQFKSGAALRIRYWFLIEIFYWKSMLSACSSRAPESTIGIGDGHLTHFPFVCFLGENNARLKINAIRFVFLNV